ncbi:hypothetical protein BD289DRAFT_224199 [Coniella lustricola]|uniref:Pleckstrin homology domain-containing protein n=1 Tax=Coniella lustricola TaxID=2025994 RepID=A0A2T3AB02_9PEZI|nr:hypothetical protein BD289DRAFT_224199 [Coniella lustricola]
MSLALGSPYSSSMAAWETEDEMSQPTSSALTTPMDAKPPSRGSRNSRNSSRHSRRSRRSVTPPGRITRSPPPMPGSDKTDKSDRVIRDLATDDKISILDPRRFTPTLHANLVGEILTLKRDQDEKLHVIEVLEATLQTTRAEGDSRETTLLSISKENRSLKRQLALLEGGTSSALGELARERDEALDGLTETRKRLETAQKKLKTQEDAAKKANDQWDVEKGGWEDERRKTDRKIHLLEARLKMVVEEMASYHANAVTDQTRSGAQGGADDDDDKAADSDSGSIRSMSVRDSLRFSLLQKTNGHSLADELDFDDDSDGQTETNGRDSAMSTPRHTRSGSRASVLSRNHHRHQYSIDSLGRTNSIARARYQSRLMHGEDARLNDAIREDEELQRTAPRALSYTDTGVQYSPPPSPKASPTIMAKVQSPIQEPTVQALAAKWEKQWEDGNHEANQRKKRITLAKPLVIPLATPQKLMVSAGAQTQDVPLSPPKTPKTKSAAQDQTADSTAIEERAIMISAATQTDVAATPRPSTPPSPSPAIPIITVHPPNSLPTSPRQPQLPQHSKDFACQVSLSSVAMTSTGSQTEEIRVDQRLEMLPPHLHPSAITSRPNSPAVGSQITSTEQHRQSAPAPEILPPRNPRRLTSIKSFGVSSPRDSVDSGAKGSPELQKVMSRRSHRISSLFSEMHDGSSGDEMDDFADHRLSETEFSTALSAPRAVKSPELGRTTPDSLIPDSPPEAAILGKASALSSTVDMLEPANVVNRYKLSGDQGIAMPRRESSSRGLRLDTRSGDMRKAAMIQNSLNTHQDETNDPPFPIPTRASSRQPVFAPAVGRRSDDSRSPTRTDSSQRKGSRMTHYRKSSLRKKSVSRSRRRPSRPPSIPPAASHSPTASCLPTSFRQSSSTHNESSHKRGHRHQNSETTATTEATGVQSHTSSQNANGVVDAIAQAMVGEWMFKYVRRRKSFGIPSADHSGKDDSSNDRHKRWVWLAPYERAILWSSKQPASGSALLGKSGRKLAIQSVLDVKDDNPAPKGQLAVFNRSILILTPQRALKFTAISAERHYLWLTALSFLAHSQQDIPEIPASVPKQAPNFELSPEQAKVRRPRIRDSIRLAKSHNPLSNHAAATTTTISSGPSDSARDFAIAPMPSIPDFPPSLMPGGYRPSPTATPMSNNDLVFGYLQQAPMSEPTSHLNNHNHTIIHEREASNDSAMPPAIPRFGREQPQQQQSAGTFHGRKRSNTGGHVPPPLSFRGFGGGAGTNAGVFPTYGHNPNNYSQSTDGGPLSADAFGVSGGGAGLGRNSEASSWRGSIAGSTNMFEAIGTMRMEAFISPLAYNRFDSETGDRYGADTGLPPLQLEYANALLEERDMDENSRVARRKTKEKRRQKSRSRSRSRTRFGNGGSHGRSFSRGGVAAWKEEYYGRRKDPFEGF